MQRWNEHHQSPMTMPRLRILQLNIRKSRPCMEALINDPSAKGTDVLLIEEPPRSNIARLFIHLAAAPES